MLRTCADSFAGIEDQEQLYMGNLLDSAKNLWTLGRTQRMAVGLGESHTQVDRAMGMLLPALLAAMSGRSGDRTAMAALHGLMGETGQGASSLDDLAQQLAAGKMTDGAPGKLLPLLFGNETGLLKVVTGLAGLKPGHAAPLAVFAAAIVLHTVAAQAKTGDSQAGLAALLGKERSGILGALPYDVRQVLEAEPVEA